MDKYEKKVVVRINQYIQDVSSCVAMGKLLHIREGGSFRAFLKYDVDDDQ